MFNLFNNQEPLDYDNYTELAAGTLNPNFGQPANGGIVVRRLVRGAPLAPPRRAVRVVVA